MALEEIFEEDHARARIDREAEFAQKETRERMYANIPPRTLSPGYYSFGAHLLRLESEVKVGIMFHAEHLSSFELAGLLALQRARATFERKHPPCSACGARQQNQFSVECIGCGVKFRRKGGK